MNYIEYLNLPIDEIELLFQAVDLTHKDQMDCFNWSFGKVRETQIQLRGEVTYTTILEIVKANSRLNEYSNYILVLRCFLSIKQEIMNITINEANTLAHMPSAKEYSAAMTVGGFDRFGYMPEVDSLAQGNILLYDKIENEPYSKCYAKLLYAKVCKDYENEINKISQ
jgi:hypothetical protein